MMKVKGFLRTDNRLLWIVAGGLLIIAVLLSFQFATRYVMSDTSDRAKTTLRLTVAGLRGALGQYRTIPYLIADNPSVVSLLSSKAQLGQALQVNRELKRINKVALASDIYVMDTSGLTLAASNYDTKTSFVGKNFNYRPYFQDAMAGKRGRYFALGTTSLKRGYYFAAPVRTQVGIIGVVVVKVNVDRLEASWGGSDHIIIVTDENGIVFMSSRSSLLFKSLKPLPQERLKAIKGSRRYNAAKLGELDLTEKATGGNGYGLVALKDNGSAVDYLVHSQAMPDQSWHVQILTQTGAARTQALTITAAVLFILLSAFLTGAFLLQRRQRLLERMENQREAQHELERRVKARTVELDSTNARLRGEINERELAEKELRKTQSDLVQAGKLAALGQMSAALSHELNQPLGAAKSYADNAAEFIDRGRVAEARENVTRISSLVDRMSSISKHLRNFARKPNEKLSEVPIAMVIHDALEILDRRIRALNVEMVVDLPSQEIWAKGGQVRLQQVLVNLINNAIDATEATPHPSISISAEHKGEDVTICVRDNGPGIADDIRQEIFDPFFTTSGIGKGLGLGLSISYNIIRDFGGQLRVENHEDGGAMFSISLKIVAAPAREAAQ